MDAEAQTMRGQTALYDSVIKALESMRKTKAVRIRLQAVVMTLDRQRFLADERVGRSMNRLCAACAAALPAKTRCSLTSNSKCLTGCTPACAQLTNSQGSTILYNLVVFTDGCDNSSTATMHVSCVSIACNAVCAALCATTGTCTAVGHQRLAGWHQQPSG